MANDYARLKRILSDPQYVATVAAVNQDGTVTATTPQGASIRLRGTAAVGKMVIYSAGRILNEMDPLPLIQITISS